VSDLPFVLPVRLSTIAYFEPRFSTLCGMAGDYPAKARSIPPRRGAFFRRLDALFTLSVRKASSEGSSSEGWLASSLPG
jgi:hypothetical protein